METYTFLLAVALCCTSVGIAIASNSDKTFEKNLSSLLTLFKRIENVPTDGTNPNNPDGNTYQDQSALIELAWELSRSYIVHGKTEKQVAGHKLLLQVPPEQTNGRTDEILSHEEKVRLNLEAETLEETNNGGDQKRKFIYPKGDDNLWPMGIVPYALNSGEFKTRNRDLILESIDWYKTHTCLEWLPYSPELQSVVGHSSYVQIQDGIGCSSNVGRSTFGNPVRVLTLNETRCFSLSTISHEMGHAIGLHHEHVRDDRDNYVEIVWDRVPENPGGTNWGKVDTFNYAPYDLGSNMHYNLYAGTLERGKKAILSKNPELDFLATTAKPEVMSFYDLLAINFAYGCADNCLPKPQCLNGGFVNKECQCVCPSGLTGDLCQDIFTDDTCGGVIELDLKKAVQIESPNFPSNYELDTDCGWLIRGPELSIIELDFKSFDIPTEQGFNVFNGQLEEVCTHHLEVRYNLIGQPGPRFCGKDWERAPIRTTFDGQSNLMLLRFNSSKPHAPGSGFQAVVSAVPIGCVSNPCQNGGSCKEKKNGPKCSCPKGFTGEYCELIGAIKILCNMNNFTTCPFDDDRTVDLTWNINEGPTLSPGTGPSSGLGGNGQYIYMEATNVAQGSSARFMSHLLKKSTRCLQFHYNMYGGQQGSLLVKILEDGEERLVFSSVGNQGDTWKQHAMTIKGNKPYRIIFEAIRGSGFQSDIALDGIVINMRKCKADLLASVKPPICGAKPCGNNGICTAGETGPYCVCPKEYSGEHCQLIAEGTKFCYFYRSKNCPFTVNKDDMWAWKTHSGESTTENTGPSKGLGKKGNYLLANASAANEGDKAKFTSAIFDASPRCLKLNYHMFGKTMGSLEIRIISDGEENVLFTRSGNQGNKWRRKQLTVESSKPYQLRITATRGSGVLSDIGIDSIKVSYGRCGEKKNNPTTVSIAEGIPFPVIKDQVTCNFDDGTFCKFSAEKGSKSDWKVKHGPSKDQLTGPLGDHTGKGCYLVLETFKTPKAPIMTSISSKMFQFGTRSQSCLSFWYHINGISPGSLTVYTDTKNTDAIVWAADDSVSPKWRNVRITIKQHSFKIKFSAQISGIEGAVAIDDVTITGGPCGKPIGPSQL